MGKLQSKQDGYFVLTCKVGAVDVTKTFMQADKPIDEILQLPDTDDFYLHIADLPLKADKE